MIESVTPLCISIPCGDPVDTDQFGPVRRVVRPTGVATHMMDFGRQAVRLHVPFESPWVTRGGVYVSDILGWRRGHGWTGRTYTLIVDVPWEALEDLDHTVRHPFAALHKADRYIAKNVCDYQLEMTLAPVREGPRGHFKATFSAMSPLTSDARPITPCRCGAIWHEPYCQYCTPGEIVTCTFDGEDEVQTCHA